MIINKTYVVQELRASIPLNVVGIKVSPSQLNVNPEFIARSSIQYVLNLGAEIYQLT